MSAQLLCALTGHTIHLWVVAGVYSSRPVNAVAACGKTIKRGVVLSASDVRLGEYKMCDGCHEAAHGMALDRMNVAFPVGGQAT